MTETTNRTALVTGANSGLGLEAAAQLADAGFSRVFITARTDANAKAARQALEGRTGVHIYEPVPLELNDLDSVMSAAERIIDTGARLDVLLLNAGIAPSKNLVKTPDGIEATVAATLIGHHALTMRLLEAGTLSDHARIVIAGSEAARGDVPMFKPADIDALAADEFNGDREAAIEALMMMNSPVKYHSGNQYATVNDDVDCGRVG